METLAYASPNLAKYGTGPLSASPEVQQSMREGYRRKSYRKEAERDAKAISRRVRPYVLLDRETLDRLSRILAGVAFANDESSRPLSRQEMASLIKAMAIGGARELRTENKTHPTPEELEEVLARLCENSIPPFCKLKP